MEETDDGMKFDSYITGPQGARYVLLPEEKHKKEDIDKAKRYLRRNFDVVSIEIYREKKKKK